MDYEQKYKEALERAKVLYAKDAPDSLHLETIFPELKESEDERIRKAIIKHFRKEITADKYYGVDKEDIFAWLEKQGKEPVGWSEDDDFMVENVRNSFGLHCGQMTPALQEQYRKFFDKVKAIKLQPNWKPSKEQIKSLYNSIPDAALYEREILTQLYVDLKKLTE